ncbi:hypothetical protein [Coleofasciculus chthonoplastes]|uniref:hypothetical protein n=1 Tax=Coleofasciculus chthonoplastes TaxID=64178 RepID=UPI0032F988BB
MRSHSSSNPPPQPNTRLCHSERSEAKELKRSEESPPMLRLILSLNSMMNAIALLKQLTPSTQHSIPSCHWRTQRSGVKNLSNVEANPITKISRWTQLKLAVEIRELLTGNREQ